MLGWHFNPPNHRGPQRQSWIMAAQDSAEVHHLIWAKPCSCGPCPVQLLQPEVPFTASQSLTLLSWDNKLIHIGTPMIGDPRYAARIADPRRGRSTCLVSMNSSSGSVDSASGHCAGFTIRPPGSPGNYQCGQEEMEGGDRNPINKQSN
jgi:hypothetical protein